MAALDPNARSTEDDNLDYQIDRTKNLIERSIQLYMNRNETAHSLEVHFGIDPRFTRLIWDKLVEDNPEFFQNYYARLELIKQINRFNELLQKQHRAMNIPLVPGAAEQQMSIELAETAPQADSPVSITNYENEAQSDPNPAGSVESEEVAGSDPNLVPGGSLAQSPLEGEGMKTNAALAAALMQISSQVPNLIHGGNHTANFRGPAQPSFSMAGSSSHLDSNPEASDQKELANLASVQGSPSADL